MIRKMNIQILLAVAFAVLSRTTYCSNDHLIHGGPNKDKSYVPSRQDHPYKIEDEVYSLRTREQWGLTRGMIGKVKAFYKFNDRVYVDFGEKQHAKGYSLVVMSLKDIDNVKPQVGVKLADRTVRGSFMCRKDYSYSSGGIRVEWKKGDLVNAIEASPGAHWFLEATGRYMHHDLECKNYGHLQRLEGCTDAPDMRDACDMKSLLLPIGTHFAKFYQSTGFKWQDILRLGINQMGGYGPNGEERLKKTFSAVVDTLEDNDYTGLTYLSSGSSKTVFTVFKDGVKYVAKVTTCFAAVRHKIYEIDLGAAPELQRIVLPTKEYFEFYVLHDSGNTKLYTPTPKELYVIIEIQEFVKCCNEYSGNERQWVKQQMSKLFDRAREAGYIHTDMTASKFANTGIMRNDDCVYIDLGGFVGPRSHAVRKSHVMPERLLYYNAGKIPRHNLRR